MLSSVVAGGKWLITPLGFLLPIFDDPLNIGLGQIVCRTDNS